MQKQRFIILGLAILGVITVFMPWITLTMGALGGLTESANGLSSDTDFNGIFVLIAFIAAGVLAFLGDRPVFMLGVIGVGALAAVITLMDILNAETGSLLGVSLRLSYGIFLAFIVGVAIAVVPILGFGKK